MLIVVTAIWGTTFPFVKTLSETLPSEAIVAARFTIAALVFLPWLRGIDRTRLQIDVEDDGPGIALGERENVLKPFYRIEGARTVDQGHVGLGMAIARDIAKSHGGDIELGRSALGGLLVSLRVPL